MPNYNTFFFVKESADSPPGVLQQIDVTARVNTISNLEFFPREEKEKRKHNFNMGDTPVDAQTVIILSTLGFFSLTSRTSHQLQGTEAAAGRNLPPSL